MAIPQRNRNTQSSGFTAAELFAWMGFNCCNVIGGKSCQLLDISEGEGKNCHLCICVELTTWSPDMMGTSRYHCNINGK